MRQMIVIVLSGQGIRALRRAQDHDGTNMACMQATGLDQGREVVLIHAPNHKIESLLNQLQQIDGLHATLTPHGVLGL